MRNFVIRIGGQDGEHYPITALLQDADLAAFTQLASASLPIVSVPANCPTLGRPELREASLISWGSSMHALMRSEPLWTAWEKAADAQARLVLDIDPPELRTLPWELLHDQTRRRWLFSDASRPVVRGTIPFAEPLPQLRLPIRLLVLIGDPDGTEMLGTDEELRAIYSGIRDLHCCWQVHVLFGASMSSLRDQFETISPHVLHFIGHGMLDDAGEPALEVAESGQDPWPLTAGFIVNALNGAPPPRLVVLNACRTSGAPDSAPQQLVWGVVGGFLDLGAAAVVSMQGDVESRSAIRASGELYTALTAGQAVDAAVASARSKLQPYPEFRVGDWALPTLTVRAEPEQILHLPASADADSALRAWGERFDNLRWFVDRSCERLEVWRRLDPEVTKPAQSAAGKNLVILTGRAEVGKSTLAKSCVVIAQLRGLPVVHVELPDDRTITWWNLLEVIARSTPSCLGGNEVQAAADAFVTDLTEIAKALQPQWAGTKPTPLPIPFVMPIQPHQPLRPSDYLTTAFDRFRSFIQTVADGQPLLVVVDNVGRMDELGTLVEHLFTPVAAGDYLPVRLLVVEQPGRLIPALSGDLRRRHSIPLAPFDANEAEQLVIEFCARRRVDYAAVDPTRWQSFVDEMLAQARKRPRAGREVLPKELHNWERAYYPWLGLS